MAAIIAAGIGAAGSLLGGVFGSNAAEDAAAAQAKALREANKLEQARYEQTRSDLAPYRDTGAAGLGSYADLMGLNGVDAQNRAREGFRTDPGYQFALDEGRRGIESSAAARGGLLSGGTLKALDRYGQGVADQQYGSYLQRFMGLAGLGQNAAAMTGQLGNASTARQSANLIGQGQNEAAGDIGQAQAWSGALGHLGDIGSYYAGQGAFGNPFGTGAKMKSYTQPDGRGVPYA